MEAIRIGRCEPWVLVMHNSFHCHSDSYVAKGRPGFFVDVVTSTKKAGPERLWPGNLRTTIPQHRLSSP